MPRRLLFSVPFVVAAATTAAADRPTANPPAPRKVRIVKTMVVKTDVAVTALIGSDDGAKKTWRVQLLGADDKPLEKGECAITRVDEKTLTCAVSATNDQVKSHPWVLVTPR